MTLQGFATVGEHGITVTLGMLMLAMFLGFLRLALGPSLPDRVVALDLISMVAVGLMATYTIASNQPVYVDAAIVVALTAFFSTVGFARYLEMRTKKKGVGSDA